MRDASQRHACAGRSLRGVACVMGLLFLWAPPGFGQDVVLRATFDRQVVAQIPPDRALSPTAPVARVPGKRGQGVVVTGSKALVFLMPPGFASRQGSIEVWVQPKDWKGFEPGARHIVRVGDLSVLKLADRAQLVARRGTSVSKAYPVHDWRKGWWHHVVVTWTGADVRLYVDGQPAGMTAPRMKPAPRGPNRLRFGPLSGETGATLLDEVYVLGAPLAPDDVQERYVSGYLNQKQRALPIITVVRTPRAPTVDGVLSPGEWDRSAMVSNFQHFYGSGVYHQQTWFWVTHDDERFYMAFKSPVIKPYRANVTQRDGPTFGDDCVEVFLQPYYAVNLEYYQFVGNSIGTEFDGLVMDPRWNGRWHWTCRRDDRWWTAELAIRYRDLKASAPRDGDRWRLNVCRTWQTADPCGTQWSVSGSYHAQHKFGTCLFRDKAPAVQVDFVKRNGDNLIVPYRLANTTRGQVTCVMKGLFYEPGSVVPARVVRSGVHTLTPDKDLRGELSVAIGPKATGLIEVLATSPDGTTTYFKQSLWVRPETFKPIVLWKDRPKASAPAKPTTRPTGAAKDGKAPGPIDWRPPMGELEAALVERQKWLGNALGKTDRVPKPWTPMVMRGRTIRCWGRTYSYEHSLLPTAIKTADEQILASPMRLVARVDGAVVDSAGADLWTESVAAHQVVVLTQKRQHGVALTCRTTVEFDGMMRMDLTVAPVEGAKTLSELALTIPLRARHARWFHWWGGYALAGYGDPDTCGAVPEAGLKHEWRPFIWLGDDERGLCWFCESDKGWVYPKGGPTMVVERRGLETRLVLRMVQGKTRLERALGITFGMQATPVKPLPRDWRTWEGKLGQIWGRQSVFSAPFLKDPDWFAKVAPNPFQLLMMSSYFYGTHWIADGRPTAEAWLFARQWSTQWREPRRPPFQPAAGAKDSHISYMACTAKGTWPDYWLYQVKKLRDTHGMRSIYLDTCVTPTDNKLVGSGFVNCHGERHGEYDIFAMRKMIKRLRAVLHDGTGPAHIQMHQSNHVCIPILSLVDSHMNGEHFNAGAHRVREHYLDVLPVDKMRAQYTSRPFGIAASFLPELHSRLPHPTRSMCGYFWTHDVGLYGAWCAFRMLGEMFKAKQSFGMGDVEFIGYWDLGRVLPGVRMPGDPPQLMVSLYRKLDGSAAMLVIYNASTEDRDVVLPLRLSAARVKVGSKATARDLETGEVFPLRTRRRPSPTLRLPVKRRDVRLIRIPG